MSHQLDNSLASAAVAIAVIVVVGAICFAIYMSLNATSQPVRAETQTQIYTIDEHVTCYSKSQASETLSCVYHP